jgi:putative ABC transport system permease protein
VRFLLRTLSLSYVVRHKAKTFLTLLGVVVGVATFSAIRGAQDSLVAGIRGTVDRMAGKAQLQVTAEGGVPEELQEALRSLPEIRAQSPVIEQIVVPERGELGSLLVLGVDLLGDREMRDYGFDGEDADLDDPLLFLAQADSVALARPLADRAGVKAGGRFVFRAPQGMKSVVVRGLLTPKGFAESFGGNLVLMDVYAAQTLFGRGRRFDRLELRLTEGTTLEAGTLAVKRLVGPAFRVETPERRGEKLERLVANFTAGFNISSGFALAIGTFLIFNAFTVSVNRRRRDIGTLRALGATPHQVQALFLAEAVVIGALGGVLGFFVGSLLSQSFLSIMGGATEQIYGVSNASKAGVTPVLVFQAIALGIAASLAGAFVPSRTAASVPPTEALAKGSFLARLPEDPAWRFAAGGGVLVLAVGVAFRPPFGGLLLIFLVLGMGAASVIALAGPLARRLLRAVSPHLARVSRVAGPLAADALLSNPRRTSGTVLAMTLSLAFVLGVGGYMGSTKAAMVRWMDDILTSDLYVRASTNLVRPDFRFPASVRDELLALPGVRAVESYRGARLDFRDEPIVLITIEIAPMMDRTRHEFLQGSAETMRAGLTREGKCAVSDNFFRRFHLGVGDSVELPTPSGLARFPIAAVVRDFTSDRGAVFLDRATFLANWKDDRVDTFDLSLRKGADAGAVRDAVRARLAGRMPALVSTRREFTAEIGKAIDAFYSLVKITVFLALAVAFLGIVTSLLISVAERTREIGILKSLGALGRQIAGSVVFEAVALALVGLVLSVPIGSLIARFMESTVAELFAGWVMPHTYPLALLVGLVVGLPIVSALAAWVPARQAARVKVTEAIEYE